MERKRKSGCPRSLDVLVVREAFPMRINQDLALLTGQSTGRFLVARQNQVVVVDLSRFRGMNPGRAKRGVSALVAKSPNFESNFSSDFGP